MRLLLSALCFASAALATPPGSSQTSGSVAGASTPLAAQATHEAATAMVLVRALETIEADNISADLHFIASDEMRGRDTPSTEQRIAARFIAARLERLGWQPGAQDGWFWNYELPTVRMDAEQCQLRAERDGRALQFHLGSDYAFSPRSSSELDVSAAALVCAGTLSEEDLEGLDLKDRWALCRSSTEVSERDYYRRVRESDALGLIVLPGGDLDPVSMSERVSAWGKAVCEPRMSRGRSNRKSPAIVYMSAGGAEKLLALAGIDEPQLGDVIDITLAEKRVTAEGATTGLENVVGIWPGSDPRLAKELLIVSAHYDHVGVGEEGEIYNGADDNGSGTVGLLAIAESLAAYGPMRRSVMLMWVSGEEKGLLGSAAWTKDPYLPNDLRPVLDINIDMIGRNAGDSLLITPTHEHEAYNGLTRLAESLREEEGFNELGSADAYWGRSDHANFSKNLKIPVAFLFADVHEDYHKPTDTPDKIDFDKIRRVSRLVVRMLHGLQTDELSL
jgi:hypothetical protein